MRNPEDIIIDLQLDNSRLSKEAIITREAIAKNDVFFKGLKYACDKLITFGVKQIPMRFNADGNGLSWDEFENGLKKLINRELTGNAAKFLIDDMMIRSTNEQWNNWYRLILIKDLRCGISEKTINKCVKEYPEYVIPVFQPQLAHPSKSHENKMKGEKIIDIKLNGVRLLTIVHPDGEVRQISREGKEILNFEKIKSQFSKVAYTLDEPMVFDGEMMSSSFQDLMTQLYRKEDVDTSGSVLYLFDMIPLEDFNRGIYKVKQLNRLVRLHSWVNQNKINLDSVNYINYERIDLDTDFGKNRFSEIYEKALDNNYEGIMIKDPNAPYERKRSTAWLKLKPRFSVDLEIIDLEEGIDKYTGMMGALICTGIEDGKEIFVNVGSGFSDELRQQYWLNKDQVIGKIAEVHHDEITKNKNGTYSLRFPSFCRLRGFDKHEKI